MPIPDYHFVPHSHAYHDARSLAIHRLIAGKIRANPALFGRVLPTIQRWKQMVDRSSLPYLEEWERLVEQGMDACLAVATEDSERATVLRQSTPFVGILTTKERNDFFKSFPEVWKAQLEEKGKRNES